MPYLSVAPANYDMTLEIPVTIEEVNELTVYARAGFLYGDTVEENSIQQTIFTDASSDPTNWARRVTFDTIISDPSNAKQEPSEALIGGGRTRRLEILVDIDAYTNISSIMVNVTLPPTANMSSIGVDYPGSYMVSLPPRSTTGCS